MTWPAPLSALALALAASPSPLTETDNDALLGVVAVPSDRGVELVAVIPESPAAEAGLQVGDQLLKLDKQALEQPADLDAALARLEPGDAVELKARRNKKPLAVEATLVQRAEFDSSFLKRRRRGETGYEAPAWYGYAWANVGKKEAPPSKENTAGKVVVVHAFQSW